MVVVSVDDGDGNPMLPFYGGGAYPVQYSLTYEGHHYYLRFRWGDLTVERDSSEEVFCGQPDTEDWGQWTDEETNVLLTLIGDAIRTGTLSSLVLPEGEEFRKHAAYRKGELPRYVVGLRCDAEHVHESSCYETVSAAELEARRSTSPDAQGVELTHVRIANQLEHVFKKLASE